MVTGCACLWAYVMDDGVIQTPYAFLITVSQAQLTGSNSHCFFLSFKKTHWGVSVENVFMLLWG